MPLGALLTVRSVMAAPRAPLAMPWCRRASVAGAARPSNMPLIVSLRPLSVAVADPLPVPFARSLAPAVGTQPSRAVNFSALCAANGNALPISAAVIAIVTMHCLSFTVTPRGSLPRESLSLRPMDAPLGAEFLQMVRHRMLEEYPGQIRACLDALGEEELWWRPHEQANAAGNLVLHLAGSNQFYLGHAIGGGPDTRDRDAEFDARGERSAADVFAVYESA